jgi:hypothetical protein
MLLILPAAFTANFQATRMGWIRSNGEPLQNRAGKISSTATNTLFPAVE